MKQPIKQKDGGLLCPECKEELAGDGENGLECLECEYHIHEAQITA